MRLITLECPLCTFCQIPLIELPGHNIWTTCPTDMVFWLPAIAITLITLSALYYAARTRAVNADMPDPQSAMNAHFKAQLAEIETDIESGRLSVEEAETAKGELARELMRVNAEADKAHPGALSVPKHAPLAALLAISLITFAAYAFLGQPDLPSLPLAGREMPQVQTSLAEAIERVEAQLEANPDDARGWTVLGPIYMQSNRFAEAVIAFRRILELLPPSADAETDLAEALMMVSDGVATGEPLALLESAAARDPDHVRSRFYLAGEATRAGDYENAIIQWQSLLALGTGDEPWIEVARNGIAVAEAGLRGDPLPTAPAANGVSSDPGQAQLIKDMVEGLSERLTSDGGSIEEWTRLVRSRVVLGELDKAQQAFDAAKAAYPDESLRVELDAIARDAGLE